MLEFNFDPSYALVNSLCYLCGTDDNEVLICDACDLRVVHFSCAGFIRMPKEEDRFFCDYCLNLNGTEEINNQDRQKWLET